MITIISDRKQIKNLHSQFQIQLDTCLTEKIGCWVGYPGGNFSDTVRYFPQLNIWISNTELDNRYWNGFGIGRPIEGANNSLVGEINFPLQNIKRSIAGVFALDDNGTILVLHRGRIGGGKRGIGTRFFKDNFRGEFVTALDGDRETEFCYVGELNNDLFPNQIADFINEIHRVKQLVKEVNTNDFAAFADFSYTDERFGSSVTERNDPHIIDRRHGIIVNTLARLLQKKGFQVGNDRNRDLFTYKGDKIITLFEIKTTSSTQSLYSAIGQLLLYSIPIYSKVRLVAVLPERLSKSVASRFSSLNIEILYYKWKDESVDFQELEKII
jgi:hypothetical protein